MCANPVGFLLVDQPVKEEQEGIVFSGLKPSVMKSGYSLSDEALRALQSGDTQALINSHRDRFGGFKMEKEDGDDDDSDDDDKKDKSDTDDSGDGDEDDDDDDDDSGGDDDKVTKAELEAAQKRMKAADQRASKAEAELKKIKDAELGDLERAQSRVTELETENTELRSSLQSERLNSAFLQANKHTWHKPGAALKLAQSEGYLEDVIKDDGTVDQKALETALNKLAKDNEFLVKSEGSGSSGDSASTRSKNGKDDKAQSEADRRRAPALSRRR